MDGKAHYYLHLASFVLAFPAALACIAMILAFLRHVKNDDALLRNLSWGLVTLYSVTLLKITMWEVVLRSWKRFWRLPEIEGAFTIYGFDRFDYLIVHYLGILFATYKLCQLLKMTIPPNVRHKWPWYKAPFYPGRGFWRGWV